MHENNIFKRFVSVSINRRLNEIQGDEPADAPWIYSQSKDAVKDTLAQLQAIVDWYKSEYREYLYETGVNFSNRRYVKNNGKVRKNLNQKRNRHLLSLLEILSENRLPYNQAIRLYHKYFAVSGKGKCKYLSPVVVCIHPLIPYIANKLGISQPLVYKYIQGMEQVCLIKRLSKKHTDSFYAIGVYRWYQDESKTWKTRPVYFLTEDSIDKLIRYKRPD